MYEYFVEIIAGLLCGLSMGITGIIPIGIVIILLELFKIEEYKTVIGSMLFVLVFPISIGSVYEFYKAKQINYKLSMIVLASIIAGSTIGSKLILDPKHPISNKTIKYISSAIGFVSGIIFLIAANNEK